MTKNVCGVGWHGARADGWAIRRPDCRRILLFTGAKSSRDIDIYHSDGCRSVPLGAPHGPTCLTKDLSVRQR